MTARATAGLGTLACLLLVRVNLPHAAAKWWVNRWHYSCQEGIPNSVIQTSVGYLRSQIPLLYDQRNHRLGQLWAFFCQCTKSWWDSTNHGMGGFSCGARKSPSAELYLLWTLKPAPVKSWDLLIVPETYETINQILSLVFYSVHKHFIPTIPKACQFEMNGTQFVYKAIWFHPEVDTF